ncbi:MAG: hypothetical protein ACJ77N_09025 [Chloroflexota bacterium]
MSTSGHPFGRGDTGPGILETSIVLGLSVVLAVAILVVLAGPLADAIDFVVGLASAH